MVRVWILKLNRDVTTCAANASRTGERHSQTRRVHSVDCRSPPGVSGHVGEEQGLQARLCVQSLCLRAVK